MTIFYVLLALLMFGVLVLLHESAHFLMARIFRVTVKEFSIGMGPRLLCRKGKKYDTEYSVRAFPIGGYVSMAGEDEETDDPDSFEKKPVWQRMLVVVAGPLVNILFGFLLTLIIVLSTTPTSNVVAQFDDNAVSRNYGLEVGDRIVRVENVPVHTGYQMSYEIMNQGKTEVSDGRVALDLVVIRDGKRVKLDDVQFRSQRMEGTLFGESDFRVYAEEKTVGSVLKHTFYQSISTVKMIVDQIVDLVGGRYNINAVSGPVGITQAVADTARTGVINLLYLVAVITVNLGVFNLVPFPALDGGRFCFLLWEGITHRPVNKKIEGYINTIGILLLFLLMIVVCCKDIVVLFVK